MGGQNIDRKKAEKKKKNWGREKRTDQMTDAACGKDDEVL